VSFNFTLKTHKGKNMFASVHSVWSTRYC